MTGKTHLAVGTASALCITQPTTLKELALCVAVASIGSVVSDVDVKTSESRRDLNKVTAVAVVVGIVLAFVEYQFNLGIIKNFNRESNLFRLLIGFSGFIAVCTFGKNQPHRSFMHSIPAVLILTGIVYFMYPVLAPFFMVSMLSHIAIDLFNRKRVKLFYPLKRGFCFNMCKASGTVNRIMFICASSLTILYLGYTILKIAKIL